MALHLIFVIRNSGARQRKEDFINDKIKELIMKNIVKVPLIVIGIFVAVIVSMAALKLCPPQGPWTMPPWCEGGIELPKGPSFPIIEAAGKFTVTVPYWTQGDVYLGIGDNPTYLKLEKVNEVTYKGTAKLKEGTEYYYSRGSLETKSTTTYKTTDFPKGLNAVIDWIDSNNTVSLPEFQKGITFGGMLWEPENFQYAESNLKRLSEFGVDWVLIIPEWFVDDQNGTEIYPFYASQGEFPNPTTCITPTLTDEQVRYLIRKSNELGYKVVLKPHIDPMDFCVKTGSSRGNLKPTSWDKWFESYKRFITHYAKIAEEENVDLFVVGTELDTSAMGNLQEVGAPSDAEQRWREVIADVRKFYFGKITYSESCTAELDADWRTQCHGPRDIKFWDALDYIGFEPYFGVTDKTNPTIAELKQGFDERLAVFAEPLYKQYNKKIIFTEVAFASYDGAGISALEGRKPNSVLDSQEQADLYEALFQAIQEKNYIKGMYPWAWYIRTPDDTLGWQKYSIGPSTGSDFDGKIAGQVIKKWYSKIDD